MSIPLLSCPFCGHEAEIERLGDGRRSTIYRCTFCSCSLETGEEWDHGRDWNRRAEHKKVVSEWLPIDTAPRDGRAILGLCDHKADPYQDPEYPDCITTYAAHSDGMGHVEDGPHVLVWGGAVDDGPDDGGAFIPDWWFLSGSDFEVAANPTHWSPIPETEKKS